MHQIIPLSLQDITTAEIEAVVAVMRSDRLSIGPRTEAFEAAVAERAGRKYGVAVNSGTSGLHLCVKALGLGEGDEVITTPFSFIATTNCVLFERAKPVLVDIDAESYNLDPAAVEAAITPQTKAILPVEVFGNTAHFDEYERIAKKHNLILLEDCCEALGGTWHGRLAHDSSSNQSRAGSPCHERPAGSFGEAGVFAFYPNKQITTGEGGMIVTDREDLRDLCRSLRNQGRATEAWLSHARMGYNFRMSEIAAAIGEAQMQRLDEILANRRRAAGLYDEALTDLVETGDLHLPPMAERETASWFVYVVRLADRFSAEDRDAVLQTLRAAGIGCNCYFSPIHTQPYIMETLGTKAGDFPVTERIAARTIALPFFSQLTRKQVARVAGVLRDSLKP
jgi:perosamine synthetase